MKRLVVFTIRDVLFRFNSFKYFLCELIVRLDYILDGGVGVLVAYKVVDLRDRVQLPDAALCNFNSKKNKIKLGDGGE